MEDALLMIDAVEEDLKQFFNQLKNLMLYMRINEPRITLDEVSVPKDNRLEKYASYCYYGEHFQAIDGFDRGEGQSICYVVLNAPKVANGSFAGIKPTVVIVGESTLSPLLMENLIDIRRMSGALENRIRQSFGQDDGLMLRIKEAEDVSGIENTCGDEDGNQTFI